MIINLIKEEVLNVLKDINLYPGHINDVDIFFTEDFKNGDAYTTFPLKLYGNIAKMVKKNAPPGVYAKGATGIDPYVHGLSFSGPLEMAQKFADKIIEKNIPFIKDVKVARNGFINFYLVDKYISDAVLKVDENFGKNDLYKGKKIMVEYTDPNPFKIFHIGHLMANAIGESFTRLIEFGGAKVIRTCYQGDVGLHVAKTIWAALKMDYENTIEFWGKAYVKGNDEYDYNKAEITEINKKVFEKSDPKINELYEKGRKLSLEYFDSIYKKLDTHFDRFFFESEVAVEGIKIVNDHPQVFEKSEGATVFKGSHTRVFLNSQGLPTYEAKELGLTATKYREFTLDKSLVITANEQNAYFKVLKEALAKIDPKYQIEQFGHGILRFADGKMSSRKGNIIGAEEFLGDDISIGAIKYSILRQAVGGDVIFDKEKSVSMEGDSGPYLQYATVRANSVLAKSKEEKIENISVGNLDRLIIRFPDIVLRAQLEYAPQYIVTYLTQLASEFNSFYTNNKILEDGYRLALTRAFVQTMKNGLHLLAIQVPEKM